MKYCILYSFLTINVHTADVSHATHSLKTLYNPCSKTTGKYTVPLHFNCRLETYCSTRIFVDFKCRGKTEYNDPKAWSLTDLENKRVLYGNVGGVID